MNLWLLGASLAAVIILMILFRYEDRAGQRLVLETARDRIDIAASKLYHRLTHISIHVGTGAFRLMVHFVIHRVLTSIMWLLRLFEQNIYRLQRRNRKVANILRDEQEKTHLHLIAEHKETNALNDEQKRQLKDQAIESN